MVSPEPVESPKRVLQRWIDAGKPAVALYALYVHDAEFRAFKRAVSVIAEGEAKTGGRETKHGTTPHRKRMRAEECPIDHDTAVHLMTDLAHVDTGAVRKLEGLPISAPCFPNNAVRCFEFGQVCAPLPMLMQHVY
jgi:hypothetical protein